MGLSINGEYVTDQILRAEMRTVRDELAPGFAGPAIDLDFRASEIARDRLIDRVLLQQAAPEVLRLEQADRPARNRVVDFYRKNERAFHASERVHAAHIVKNVNETTREDLALSAIQLANAELGSGRPFAAVADERSDCPGRGGDLGWIVSGEMVDEFEAVIFSLKPRQTSPIFRTPFGFHIATVHERRKAGIRPLSEIYPDVERVLMDAQRRDAIETLLSELRAKADIRRTLREGTETHL